MLTYADACTHIHIHIIPELELAMYELVHALELREIPIDVGCF
jgi:hypothetical protein